MRVYAQLLFFYFRLEGKPNGVAFTTQRFDTKNVSHSLCRKIKLTQLFFHFRIIILKCSDFDSKKLLLDAVRTKFGGEVRTDDSTTNSHIEGLWECLEGEFRTRVPETVRTGYIAEHLGYQSLPNIENYWYLEEEVIFKVLMHLLLFLRPKAFYSTTTIKHCICSRNFL